jgi:hypothetical protein
VLPSTQFNSADALIGPWSLDFSAVQERRSRVKLYAVRVGTTCERNKSCEMWKFLSKVVRGTSEPTQTENVNSSSSRVSSMLQAIDEGISQRPIPTLVCRKCGVKYNNTGTYLSGSQCPDCTSK